MNLEGRLQIQLSSGEGTIDAVSIRSTRPLGVVSVLRGRTPADALNLIPTLFPICGMAQAYASLQALRRATGVAGATAADRARQALVDAESVRELGLRILLDWSVALGEAPPTAARTLAALPARCRRDWFGERPAFALNDDAPADDPDAAVETLANVNDVLRAWVFGMRLDEWRDLLASSRERWIEHGPTLAARFLRDLRERGWADAGAVPINPLPALGDRALLERLSAANADRFVAEPEWDGKPCENTRLSAYTARQSAAESPLSPGLSGRSLARLSELAALFDGLLNPPEAPNEEPPVVNPAPGTGIGRAMTARGLLIHYARVEDGRIADYRILAPTEWNFHPQGVVPRALKTLVADDPDSLLQQARWLIDAIDPCVGVDLEWE